MRVTTFTDEANRTAVHVAPSPAWEPFDEYDGQPLEGVRLMVVERLTLGEIQLVEIAAGGHFAMHASSDVAFCQVVRGKASSASRTGRRSRTKRRSCTCSTLAPCTTGTTSSRPRSSRSAWFGQADAGTTSAVGRPIPIPDDLQQLIVRLARVARR